MHIGQVIRMENGPLFEAEGKPGWHCLIVPPQRESACEAWLKWRGVDAFFPVRVSSRAIRGRRKQIISRYLPGYVFARFPRPIIWHRVAASPLVTDIVRMADGKRIAHLEESDLTALRAMAYRDQEERARRKAAQAIRVGSKVIMPDGPFDGEFEVWTIDNGVARFRIRMFGGDIEAEVAIERLLKIG